MIENMLLQIAMLVFFLLCVGIGLTIYEFKQHIVEHNKKKR
jgi:hypothetical protein